MADEHQRSGLGTVLLEHLAELARQHGVATFVVEVLAGDATMLQLLTDSGLDPRNDTDRDDAPRRQLRATTG